jgi:hypothetical protein
MEFPPDWRVDNLGDFYVAIATLATSGDKVATELLAQLRPNGQVLDNFKFVVNVTQILDTELDFERLLPSAPLKGYQLRYQYWPRDITIRWNLTTSNWFDADMQKL